MRVLLIVFGVIAALALLGNREDSVSRSDIRNSAEQKYLDNADKTDFARTVIGASGHTCPMVTRIGDPVEVGTTMQRLALCRTGETYVIGLSRTGPGAQAEPCATSTATACRP